MIKILQILQPDDFVISEDRVQAVIQLLQAIISQTKISPQELALAVNHISFLNGLSQAKKETPKIAES